MKEEVKKEFGENLKKYRKKAGYTQKDLGDKLKLTLAAVSKWEKGQALPEFSTLYDLCTILNIHIDDLLGKYALKQADTTPEDNTRLKRIKDIVKELIKELE